MALDLVEPAIICMSVMCGNYGFTKTNLQNLMSIPVVMEQFAENEYLETFHNYLNIWQMLLELIQKKIHKSLFFSSKI